MPIFEEYCSYIRFLTATFVLFSPFPVTVRLLAASAYGGLIYITNFLRFSSLLMISCKGCGNLLNGSFRKSNWNTWLSSRLAPLTIRSCITSTSAWSSVEAQILYLLVNPFSKLPVPAAQSQTVYSSCQFSPNSAARYCWESSTHFCGVKYDPFRSRTS